MKIGVHLITASYEAIHDGNVLPPDPRAKVFRLPRTFAAYRYLAGTRRGLALRGLNSGPPRLPLVTQTGEQVERLDAQLQGCRELVSEPEPA